MITINAEMPKACEDCFAHGVSEEGDWCNLDAFSNFILANKEKRFDKTKTERHKNCPLKDAALK